MNHVLSWEPSPTATNSATTPTSGALGTLRREGIRPAERSGLGTSPPNNNNNNTNNTLTRSPPCHSPSTTDAISSTMMYNHYGSTHTTPDLRPRRWVSELGSMAAFALEPAALAKAAAAPSSIDPHVAPWRHDSDALRGWQLLSSGGCVRQRNPTASHLVLITEEGLRNTATAFSRSRSRTPSVGAANTDVIAATTTTTTTTAASVLIPVDAAPSHEEHTSSGSSRGCSATDLPNNNNNNNNTRSVRWAHDDEDAAHRTPIPSTGDEKSYSSATGAVERLALSCADVLLLRAAVPLPHGKSEACFVAQVQRLPYRANNMRPPTSTTTGSDAATTTTTTTTTRQPTSLFAMAITPRANEEANTKTGIPALVLRVDEPSGDATLCVEMWRVVPLADHAERVRVVEEAVDLELTNDRVLLRLVVRDGGFDVYADDVLVFDGVEADGAKLGEATAIFFASGGCHSLRQIAIAEGERPPSSRFLQPLRRESVEEEANEDVPPPAARSVRNSNTSSAARTPTQSCAAAKPTTTTTSERNSPKRGANNNNNAAAARPPPPASAPSKRSPPRVGGAPTRHVDPSATTPPTATTPTAKTSTRRSLAPTSSPSSTTPPSSSSLANTPARNNSNNNNNTKNTRRQVPKRRAACTSDDVDDPRRSVADLPPDIDPTLAAYIQAEVLDTSPNVSWDDVVGVGAAKRLLKEAVLLPLLVPELFVGVVQPWRGVLLYGPPGTGKTMLAKAVATSAKTTFFGMSAASLTSKHYGESEKLVRTLFQLARLYAPSTIFIDEVDALMSSRGGSEHEASRRIKSELLQQMDGLPSQADNKRVLVFGITNRPWDLDEAMRRRMEKRVYVPLLDRDGRLQLLQQLTSTLVMEEEVQLDEMATSLEGYSGADISMVVRDAAMMPVRRLMDAHGPEELTAMQHAGTLEVSRISAEDFCVAQRRSRPSVSQGSLGEFERWTEDFGSA